MQIEEEKLYRPNSVPPLNLSYPLLDRECQLEDVYLNINIIMAIMGLDFKLTAGYRATSRTRHKIGLCRPHGTVTTVVLGSS